MSNKRIIATTLTILSILLLTSCSDKLNVLVIPEDGDCYAGKVSYSDWTGKGGTITLLDKNSNAKTCEGTYSMVGNAVACIGKKFHAKIACKNGRTADLNFTTTSCTEAYGTAVDNLGNEYKIYLGISEEAMKSEVAKSKKDKNHTKSQANVWANMIMQVE